MSPLVRRTVTSESAIANTKRERAYVAYVSPDDVEPGDVVVKPTFKQAQDLAVTHPEEFGPDGVNLFDAGIVGKDPDEAFREMRWQEAVAQVHEAAEGENAEEDLDHMFEWESSRTPPRLSVLKALAQTGHEGATAFLADNRR